MSTPTVAGTLQLANGVTPAEFDRVVAVMGRLDERLRSFPAGTVELQLSVKERDTPSQRTTLEAWIAGQPRLVATSNRADLDGALAEVRDELIRQITDAKNRTEPRNARSHRDTL
jgi:ribosome-associated translation inhibitor RaiA